MGETRDLELILDSRIPLVQIASQDEPRVLELLTRLAMARGLPLHAWTATRGLQRGATGGPVRHGEFTEPEDMLWHVLDTQGPAIYALCDLMPWLQDEPRRVRLLKDICLDYPRLGNTVVVISHDAAVPAELGRFSARFNLAMPTREQLLDIVREQARAWSTVNAGARVKTDARSLDRLVGSLRGVTLADAEVLVRHAIFADGAIGADDLPAVNRLKYELLDQEGVLRYEHDVEDLANVAGLARLKAWLGQRQGPFLDPAHRDRPRGLLLLGVQGSGKSLAARAVAGAWGLPLLRLDFGTLYNKYHGETERNLRQSLQQAETMSPCVLWLDELEKGISTAGSDNAVAKRVLGTFLTWLSEHRTRVFTVATSNDVSQLPPELLRKGRFDELFFLDLPGAEAREEIFRIHLARRSLDPTRFDLDELASRAEGFTGAEIEQAIVAANYHAAAEGTVVATDSVLEALGSTLPLSVLRQEDMEALRTWAAARTVPAD